MKKAILLDFDGVICNSRYFREIYSEKFNVDHNILTPFFDAMKESVVVGQGDLLERLEEVLVDWQWKGSAKELLDFWMNSDPEIDARFIKKSEELRKKGHKVYLASDQEQYRANHIWLNRGLNKWMDGKFFSCEIGMHKDNPKYFEYVIRTLNIEPSDIYFFDDSKRKVDLAKSSGVNAFVYTAFEDFAEVVETF